MCIEILAPAGSMESLYAAINAGCDAVYIGGGMFGARAYASNPDKETLLYAIDYCHMHNVKLYLAVNTLLKEEEIADKLYNYIMPYYKAGIDAAIVQDMGVIYFLHKYFPKLALHASTQMTIVTGKAAGFLKDYGITRIVPARELSMDELYYMRQDTGLEIEVFVHGALCYCYSGQCLFSSMAGGRSGNRGRCAQPCRLPYLLDFKGIKQKSFILSMKELCALPYIGELIEIGVSSFKIEGRMKSPAYTALATSLYRKYTDFYMSYGSCGYEKYIQEHKKELLYDMRQLAEVYNREGFTSDYLSGRAKSIYTDFGSEGYDKYAGFGQKNLSKKEPDMLSSKRPKHGGVFIGNVISTGNGVLSYKAEKDINAQDVLEFRNKQMDTLYEYTSGKDIKAGSTVEAKFKHGCNICKGDSVYRTKNAYVLNGIKEKYLKTNKKVLITGSFKAAEGKEASLSVEKDGIKVTVYSAICQKADKNPADKAAVKKILLQTGNTEFSFKEIEIILEDNLFLPVSMLKNLRREALEKLCEKIISGYKRNADITFTDKNTGNKNTDCNITKSNVTGGNITGSGITGGNITDSNITKSNITGNSITGGNITKSNVTSSGITDHNLYNANIQLNTGIVYKASVMNFLQLNAVLENQKISEVYIKTELLDSKSIREALLEVQLSGRKCYAVLPHIFRQMDWDYEERMATAGRSIYQYKWDGFVIRNIEGYVFLTKVLGISPENIITDTGLYIMNSFAGHFWEEHGVKRHTVPFELEIPCIKQAALTGMEVVIYTHIPLMVSAQCVISNLGGCKGNLKAKQIVLKDIKEREFIAVNYCKYCYSTIYQKMPLYALQCIKDLENAGVKDFRYDFTIENAEETRIVLDGRYSGKTYTGHYNKGIL